MIFEMLRLFLALIFSVLVSGSSFAGPIVTITTTEGDIILELNEEKAPKTVANYLERLRDGDYNNVFFHYLSKGNYVLAGEVGETSDDPKAPRYRQSRVYDLGTIPSEADNGLRWERGSIAMELKKDGTNSALNFLLVASDLKEGDKDGGKEKSSFTVFGKVTSGMEVVDKISNSEVRLVQTVFQTGGGPVNLKYWSFPSPRVKIVRSSVKEEETSSDSKTP